MTMSPGSRPNPKRSAAKMISPTSRSTIPVRMKSFAMSAARFRLPLGDAHLDRGAHLLGQIVQRIEHGLELGAKPVNLVDEVEQNWHLILVEAELVLEV